jgi:hypothetical protein
MKILVDESLPVLAKKLIVGHTVFTVYDLGWKGVKNGVLLRKAVEHAFDAVITSDKNMPHQQDLSKFNLAFLILDIRENDIDLIRPLVPQLMQALQHTPKGSYLVIS